MLKTLPLLLLAGCAGAAPRTSTLDLNLRRGESTSTVSWSPKETAVIICDMWDTHTCKGAASRVGVMAPKLDAAVSAARSKGALIVHAPSDVIKFYGDTPQRKRVLEAPAAKGVVEFKWRKIMPEREGALPLDDSDWCDCRPKCDINAAKAKGWPWSRQHEAIKIHPEDAISDQGQEIFNLFEQRGIKNVILCGVHTNMCVLGRSFGIRQMVLLGKNVALIRDLTDCLYDPDKPPKVSHDQGTALLVAHIEKHWCPSFLSADLLR